MGAGSDTAPSWGSSALLVIDMQHDFLSESPVGVPGTTEVLGRVSALVSAFRASGRPIVHVVRIYQPDGTDADLVRREALRRGAPIVLTGTPGAEPAPGLLPGEDQALDTAALLRGEPQQVGPQEIVLFKPRWSAFFRTSLAEWLAERDVDTVVVAGCNFPNCPRATAVDAISLDLRVVLVPEATSLATPERVADVVRLGPVALGVEEVVAAVGGAL